MKFVTRWGLFSATVLLMFANCITTQKANLSTEDLAGTWLNEEYNTIESYHNPKRVVTADGVAKGYDKIADKEPESTYKISIVESWYDENGDIWFKCVWENIGPEAKVVKTKLWYSINKLSSSGTVWECCWQGSDYPTGLSQLGGGYTIHFRQ